MIHFKTGDIFAEPVEALVNPVNCVGVMGAGLALEFKRRFPANFATYRVACSVGTLRIGTMLVTETGVHEPRYIVNFPTKRHWRNPSVLSSIALGLTTMLHSIASYDIRSVAMPAIGCGLGGLDWSLVRKLLTARLSDVPNCEVVVFEPK